MENTYIILSNILSIYFPNSFSEVQIQLRRRMGRFHLQFTYVHQLVMGQRIQVLRKIQLSAFQFMQFLQFSLKSCWNWQFFHSKSQ